MTGQLRAELLKLRTTRTTAAFLLGMIALVLLVVLVQGFTMGTEQLSHLDQQQGMMAVGGAGTLFTSILGVLLVTNEFRYGTVRPTLLFEPRRERVIAAKLLAGLGAGVVFGIVGEGLALGVGRAALSARGVPLALDRGELLQLGLGTVAVAALWTGIGVGVGAIIRNQVGAIIGLLAWIFIAQSLLFGLVPSVGRFTPGPAGDALIGTGTAHLLGAVSGGLLLVAYTAAVAAAGAAVTLARDVE